MEIKVLVKSSSETPYSVVVTNANGKLFVFCNCRAGEWGKLCKHKKSVISGDKEVLFDETELERFTKLQFLFSKTEYIEILKELHNSENELDVAKIKVKGLKEKLSRSMRDGVIISA